MSSTVTSKSSPTMDTGKLIILFSLFAIGKSSQNNTTTHNLVESPPPTAHQTHSILNKHLKSIENLENVRKQSNDIEEFRNVFLEYAKDVIDRETINIVPGVYIQRKPANFVNSQAKSYGGSFIESLRKFTETHDLRVDLARASTATGRLFFFKGELLKLK